MKTKVSQKSGKLPKYIYIYIYNGIFIQILLHGLI